MFFSLNRFIKKNLPKKVIAILRPNFKYYVRTIDTRQYSAIFEQMSITNAVLENFHQNQNSIGSLYVGQ